jgi:hypothetical protein
MSSQANHSQELKYQYLLGLLESLACLWFMIDSFIFIQVRWDHDGNIDFYTFQRMSNPQLTSLLCWPALVFSSAVLGDSSAPDKGTRVKVAGIVVHEEGGHTESAAHAHFLTLEGDRYQSLWPQYIAKVGSGR